MLLGGFRCCCNLSYVKTCDIMSPYFHDSILITMKNKLLINAIKNQEKFQVILTNT